jgi:uncharacterized hydrophobic protein (TIGR00271 family)
VSLAILLRSTADLPLVDWAALVARSRRESLVLYWVTNARGPTQRRATREGADPPAEVAALCEELSQQGFHRVGPETTAPPLPDASAERPGPGDFAAPLPPLDLEVVALTTEHPVAAIEQEVREGKVRCLIVPRAADLRSRDREFVELHGELLSRLVCEVMLLTPGREPASKCEVIVSLMGDGPHSGRGLHLARQLADTARTRVKALYVEPAVDEVASQVGERILARRVRAALGEDISKVDQQVVVHNDVLTAVLETLDGSEGLIVLGMPHRGVIQRFMSQGLAEKLVPACPGPAIAVFQTAMPRVALVLRRLESGIQQWIPQISRERRVALVERIQASSRWNIDFVLLICLSTLIAAVGLIQDSTAVVIGAMLVAPLMTPLLGTGLSLAQGNRVLFRETLLTVARGFFVALLIGWLMGFALGASPTSQMDARGAPGVFDLLVALFSGIAAAYASGRPHLVSALPGVAIAASLVPPIATSGLAAHVGDYDLAFGAAMLFLTNILAIVVGTALAFWCVGIRGKHRHGDEDPWVLLAGAALVITTLLVGYVDAQRYAIPPGLEGELAELVAREATGVSSAGSVSPDVQVRWHRRGTRHGIQVQVATPTPLSQAALTTLRDAVIQRMDTSGAEAIWIRNQHTATFEIQ